MMQKPSFLFSITVNSQGEFTLPKSGSFTLAQIMVNVGEPGDPPPYATHPLFLDNLPALRRTLRQKRQPQIQVELFDEIVAANAGRLSKKGD